MEGKGRALDNVSIERFWKPLKYDYVYLHPAQDGFELYEGIQSHIDYYNNKIHQSTKQKPNLKYQETSEIVT